MGPERVRAALSIKSSSLLRDKSRNPERVPRALSHPGPLLLFNFNSGFDTSVHCAVELLHKPSCHPLLLNLLLSFNSVTHHPATLSAIHPCVTSLFVALSN